MKNSILIISILTLFSATFFGQELSGKYTRNQNEYLIFLANNKIDYLFSNSGDFYLEKHRGIGNYKIKRDKIIINVESHLERFESTYEQVPTSKKNRTSEIEFIVQDINNEPIPFASISYRDSRNKNEETESDKNGIARLSIPLNLESEVVISFVGLASAIIPIQDIKTGKIVVTLTDAIFVDPYNAKIKMKLILNDEEKTFEIESIKIKKLATTHAKNNAG